MRPVKQTAPGAGIPSSGNVRIPEWMVGEDAADDEPKKGKRLGCGGAAVFLIAVLAAAALFAVKQAGGGSTDVRATSDAGATSQVQAVEARPEPLPDRALPSFEGKHTRADGRVTDKAAGVSYPRLGSPWRSPSKSGLEERGFTAQRYVVTEKARSQVWYGQLMSGTLSNAQQRFYGGRGTEREAATALARQFEDRFYPIAHERREVASQQLTVDDHRGWVVAYFVSYDQPGIKAKGDMVAVAVIDTGRPRPAVLFMAVPDTHKKLWPDFNYVLSSVRVLPDAAR